jgi:signal transduction histidine kinase
VVARWAIAIGVAAAGVAVGALSLSFARNGPAYSFAGTSAVGGLALIAAGSALITTGLASGVVRRRHRLGVLLAAAGFAWFLLEWNNPQIGSALAFTVGTVLYAVCPALVGHAVLSFPDGRLDSRIQTVVVATAYFATVFVLGLLPAFLFDPGQGCGQCPRNLLLVTGRASAYAEVNRAGLWLATVSLSALAVLVLLKLVRSSAAARRSGWIVLASGAAYLSLAAAMLAASLHHRFLWPGSLERQLWRVQAVALVGVVLGVGWVWVRAARRRSAVARLVVELAQSPPPGGLRDALARIVGDGTLELAYPLEGSEQLVDANGLAVILSVEKEQTCLVSGGRPLAVLAHTPGVLDDEQLVSEVTEAARLALENERLQAEVRARLDELRRSRARIVEAGDAERRRLERDLHDGAQQRLAGLALSLRLVRSRLPTEGDAVVADELAEAEADLQLAIHDLRELAHGIFPAELADRGLAAAVTALAEGSSVPVRVEGISTERYMPEIETAAYVVVAETIAAAKRGVVVHTSLHDGSLVLELDARGLGLQVDLAELEDRVRAADGHLFVTRSNGDARIRAEFPCVS